MNRQSSPPFPISSTLSQGTGDHKLMTGGNKKELLIKIQSYYFPEQRQNNTSVSVIYH